MLTAVAPVGRTAALAESRVAPDFALKSTDGRNLRLSEYRGDPVVLTFWGSWCGPCREALVTLEAIARETGTPVLGVNLDGSADRAAAIVRSIDLTFPNLVDGQQSVARAYDVAKLPLTLLLDREGVVQASWSGAPVDRAELIRRLETLRDE